MGVAGAFLTLSAFNAFYFNMVNGRGWVCVALVVFASWRPGKALLGALLFALLRRAAAAPAAGGLRAVRRRRALPGVPDAAVCDGHRGAGGGGAPRRLPAGADEALPQGRALDTSAEPPCSISSPTPRCPMAAPACASPVRDGRIVAMAAGPADARGAEVHRRRGLAGRPPFVDRAFPHGRDAVPWPAAAEPLGHAARRHRAVGRAEAAPDARGGGRARAALLRLGRLAGAAGDPHPCRRLRRPAAGGRGAARGARAGRALHRPAARGLPAGRPVPLARTRGRTWSARSTWASTWSAASRISNARWRTARPRDASLCEIAAERGLPVDMHCDESDDPDVAPYRDAGGETVRLGLAGPGGRLAPAPRCIRWTTTMSRS